MKTVKIANGQGFWGDSIDAPKALIEYGEIDYLTLDYLAEVTLSIMQRQKIKNNDKGYASDFIDLISENFELIVSNKIKIVTINMFQASQINSRNLINYNIYYSL